MNSHIPSEASTINLVVSLKVLCSIVGIGETPNVWAYLSPRERDIARPGAVKFLFQTL